MSTDHHGKGGAGKGCGCGSGCDNSGGCSTKSGKGVTPERVRQRAFEIYKARKGGQGDPVADWLQAEAELRGRPVVRAGAAEGKS